MNIFNDPLDANTLDDYLQDLLRTIGGILQVSRSYIFEYFKDTDTMSNTYEWVQRGITPEKDKLQDIPMVMSPYWQEFMLNNQIINFSNVRDIPSFPENQVMMEQGIESLLVVPIYIDGKYYGFLGVDECTYQRTWTDLEIDFLKAMVVFVMVLVEKKHAAMAEIAQFPREFAHA